MRTPEATEKQKVKAFLDEIGACHRWPVPYGYGRPDIDCHASIGGVFWALEAKKPGAEPTAIQWKTLREWEASGARVAWGTAADIMSVIERWIRWRGHGGAAMFIDTDPHATAANSSARCSGSESGTARRTRRSAPG